MHGLPAHGSHYFGGQQSTECRQAAFRTDSLLSTSNPWKNLARSPRKPLICRWFTEAAAETTNASNCVVVLAVPGEPVSAKFDRKQGINREIMLVFAPTAPSDRRSRRVFNDLRANSLLSGNRESVDPDQGTSFGKTANVTRTSGGRANGAAGGRGRPGHSGLRLHRRRCSKPRAATSSGFLPRARPARRRAMWSRSRLSGTASGRTRPSPLAA